MSEVEAGSSCQDGNKRQASVHYAEEEQEKRQRAIHLSPRVDRFRTMSILSGPQGREDEQRGSGRMAVLLAG